jgi:hypothetical protein
MDGYKPSAVIESSPGNWQAIITIPKLGTELDREIGNAIVARLNKEYGDPKVSGEIHAHRAPGFQNKKLKHKRDDGTYPEVLLKKTGQGYCEKTIAISREMYSEIIEEKKRHAGQISKIAERFASANGISLGDTHGAYLAHCMDVMRIQKKHGVDARDADMSRIDAMVGIRLRMTGHSRQAIEEAIGAMSPQIRKELEYAGYRHKWGEYAARTADYVFNSRGDAAMKKLEAWREAWMQLEQGYGREVAAQISGIRQSRQNVPVSISAEMNM